MLYAVAEIAIFMVVATIVGFLLGRVTKRSASGVSGDNDSELTNAQTALREDRSGASRLEGATPGRQGADPVARLRGNSRGEDRGFRRSQAEVAREARGRRSSGGPTSGDHR